MRLSKDTRDALHVCGTLGLLLVALWLAATGGIKTWELFVQVACP